MKRIVTGGCEAFTFAGRRPRLFELCALALAPLVPKIAGMLPGPHWHGPIPMLLAVAVYPFLEECVFRAGMQRGIERALLRSALDSRCCAAAAAMVSSVLFACAHSFGRDLGAGLRVSIPALALGWLYARHRSLSLNSAIHAWWNAVFVI